MSVRIVLVDDHTLVTDGIRAALEGQPGMEVVGVGRDGAEAVQLAQQTRPHLVLLDVSMPRLNGIEAARRIRAALPNAKILFVSMHVDEKIVSAALEAGATGYILKERAVTELLQAIATVLSDKVYLCPVVKRTIARNHIAGHRPPDGFSLATITAREREVLQLIAEGNSTKEIAALLNVSAKTVSTHRQSLMDKLDLHNIAGLTTYAIRHGLVFPETDPERVSGPRRSDRS